jgi:hypothetical protein
LRFDACRPIAEAMLTDGEAGALDRAVAALSLSPPASAPPAIKTSGQASGRPRLAGGITALALGLAAAGTGAYLATDAARRYDQVNAGCAPSTPCSGEELGRRKGAYQASTASAAVLLPVGAIGLVAGGVLIALGARRRLVTPSVAVSRDRLTLDAEFAF